MWNLKRLFGEKPAKEPAVEPVVPAVRDLTLEEIQNLNYESGKRVADKLDEVADKLKENALGRDFLIDVKDTMEKIGEKLRDGSQATAVEMDRFDAAALQAVEQIEYLWKYGSDRENIEDTVARLKDVLTKVRFSTDAAAERVRLKCNIGIMWLDIIAQQGIMAEYIYRRDENKAILSVAEDEYFEAKSQYKAGRITEQDFAYARETYDIKKQLSTTIDLLNTQIETIKQTIASIEVAIGNAKAGLNNVVISQDVLDKLEEEFKKLADGIIEAAKTRHAENVRVQEMTKLIQEKLSTVKPVVLPVDLENNNLQPEKIVNNQETKVEKKREKVRISTT